MPKKVEQINDYLFIDTYKSDSHLHVDFSAKIILHYILHYKIKIVTVSQLH